uniref:Uncharacterized protein n=1 Tax=Octopus bimaculoides TaxID=37653 RepID=A0A0L8FH97_OCTBM
MMNLMFKTMMTSSEVTLISQMSSSSFPSSSLLINGSGMSICFISFTLECISSISTKYK